MMQFQLFGALARHARGGYRPNPGCANHLPLLHWRPVLIAMPFRLWQLSPVLVEYLV